MGTTTIQKLTNTDIFFSLGFKKHLLSVYFVPVQSWTLGTLMSKTSVSFREHIVL